MDLRGGSPIPVGSERSTTQNITRGCAGPAFSSKPHAEVTAASFEASRSQRLEEKRSRFLKAVKQSYINLFDDHFIASRHIFKLRVSILHLPGVISQPEEAYISAWPQNWMPCCIQEHFRYYLFVDTHSQAQHCIHHWAFSRTLILQVSVDADSDDLDTPLDDWEKLGVSHVIYWMREPFALTSGW